MYICALCDTSFDQPFVREYVDPTVDPRAKFQEILCPVCFQPYVQEADRCPKCNGEKYKGDILCRHCRKKLLDRFTQFADWLTAEEEAQLDEWMDGDSVQNRRNWT